MLALVSAAAQNCEIASGGVQECQKMAQQDTVKSQILIQKTASMQKGVADEETMQSANTTATTIPVYTRTDGEKCGEDDKVGRGKCVEFARLAGLEFTKFQVKEFRKIRNPSGCFRRGRRLYYNMNLKAKGTCDTNRRGVKTVCVCADHPHGKTAYVAPDGICPEEHMPSNGADCKHMASELDVNWRSYERMSDNRFPPGCFTINFKLWWNCDSRGKSPDGCDHYGANKVSKIKVTEITGGKKAICTTHPH